VVYPFRGMYRNRKVRYHSFPLPAVWGVLQLHGRSDRHP
jgi:hypothetical protein